MSFDLKAYQEILCGKFPDFLNKYISLKILTRLKGVGLLCGTDWTPLFQNKFFYSRFDHSVNCALIVWNFTRDKKMTLAALLHDVSTPAFSHVIDFKNGDALKQESTESLNLKMIHADEELARALAKGNLSLQDVDDYHKYSVCDNEVPQLSADRLEYMFPSGAGLQEIFSLRDVKNIYNDLTLAQDENGKTEFAFRTEKIAFEYFKRCIQVGWILQRNEDKIAMELLAVVVDKALKCGALQEGELFSLSEQEIIARWDKMLADSASVHQHKGILGAVSNKFETSITFCIEKPQFIETSQSDDITDFLVHYKTFRTMKEIRRSETALPEHFCVNLKVKRRYINPLVLLPNGKAERLCSLSKAAATIQHDFLSYNDAPFGCVKLCEL